MTEKLKLWLPKFKSAMKWFFLSFIWLGILMLVIDIVSKQLVIANKGYLTTHFITLAKGKYNVYGVDLIPGFLAISYVINENVAFGIEIANNPALTRGLYIAVSLIISAIIIFCYIRYFKKTGKYVKATLMLILVGALGNCIDRMFYSPEFLGAKNNGVVDWINFYGIWPYNFNWADSCIVVGVIMLVVWLIVEEVKDYKKAKKLEVKVEGKILSKDEQARLEHIEALKEEKKAEEIKPSGETSVTPKKVTKKKVKKDE